MSKTPKISIIIPVYNQLQYTLNCLYSLMKECANYEVEIIVINDNSTDNTLETLENIPGIKIINNTTNQGFLKNINNGIKLSEGEFVLLLNNDVVVLPDMIKELFYVWENKTNVGAVGALSIHPSGVVMEAGSRLFSDGEAINIGRLASLENPHYKYINKVDYCSGYCLLLKRYLQDGKLAQLDECFLPAYYEETDFCMQLRYLYNLDIYYQPFAKLIHFESISYGQEKNSKKQILLDQNKQKFKNKWALQLSKNHGLKFKKHKDFLNYRQIENAYLYTQDVLQSDNLEFYINEQKLGKKITILLKGKNFLTDNQIELLQRNEIEILYPYTTNKGKSRTFFKIFKRIIPGFQHLKTKNIIFKILHEILR